MTYAIFLPLECVGFVPVISLVDSFEVCPLQKRGFRRLYLMQLEAEKKMQLQLI